MINGIKKFNPHHVGEQAEQNSIGCALSSISNSLHTLYGKSMQIIMRINFYKSDKIDRTKNDFMQNGGSLTIFALSESYGRLYTMQGWPRILA